MAKLTKQLLDQLIFESLLGEQAKPSDPQEYLEANKSLGGTLSVPRIKFNNIVATEGAKTGFITKATQALGTSNDIDAAIDKICNFFNEIITSPATPATQKDVTELINNTALAQGLFMATQDYDYASLGFIMESYFAAIIQGTVAGSNQQAEDLYKVDGNNVYFYSSKFLTKPNLQAPDKIDIGAETSSAIKKILQSDELEMEPYQGKQVGTLGGQKVIRYIVGIKDNADNPTKVAFYYYDFPESAFGSAGVEDAKVVGKVEEINRISFGEDELKKFNTNFEASVNNFAAGLGDYYKSINNFKILMNSYLVDWTSAAADGATKEFANLKKATNVGLGKVGKQIAEQKLNEETFPDSGFDVKFSNLPDDSVKYTKAPNKAGYKMKYKDLPSEIAKLYSGDKDSFINLGSSNKNLTPTFLSKINTYIKNNKLKKTGYKKSPSRNLLNKDYTVEYEKWLKSQKDNPFAQPYEDNPDAIKYSKLRKAIFGVDRIGTTANYINTKDDLEQYGLTSLIKLIDLAKADGDSKLEPEDVTKVFQNKSETELRKVVRAIIMNTPHDDLIRDINAARAAASADSTDAVQSQTKELPAFTELSRAVDLEVNKKAKEILEANKDLGAGESVPDFQLTQQITKQGNADLFWLTLGENLNAKNNITLALQEICRTANGLQFGEFEFTATQTKDKITELLSRMILLQSFIKAVRTTHYATSGFTQENWLAILIQGLVQGSNQQAEDLVHEEGGVTTYYSSKLYDKVDKVVPLGQSTYNSIANIGKPITYIFGLRDSASNPTKIQFFTGTYDFSKASVPQYSTQGAGGLLFSDGNFQQIPDGLIQITDTSIDSMIQTFGSLTNELSIDLNALYKSMNNFQIFMNGYFQEWDASLADAAIQEFGAMKEAINQALAVGGQETIAENKFEQLDLMVENMVKQFIKGSLND